MSNTFNILINIGKKRMRHKNITLIGMPGAGKSTIGVLLAKVLGYHFIDSDIVIQETEGKLLHEIIKERGVDGFLHVEDRVNASIECENSVIATGGSVVYCENAMKHLKEISTAVYLELDYEAVAIRLGNLKDRGVALKEGQTLKDLYDERVPLYKKYADITVNVQKNSVQDCMRAVVDALS